MFALHYGKRDSNGPLTAAPSALAVVRRLGATTTDARRLRAERRSNNRRVLDVVDRAFDDLATFAALSSALKARRINYSLVDPSVKPRNEPA